MSNFAPSSFRGPLPDLPDLLKGQGLMHGVFATWRAAKQAEEAREVARILALPTKKPEPKP